MSLLSMVNRLSLSTLQYSVPPSFSRAPTTPTFQPSRSYINNFFNEKTKINLQKVRWYLATLLVLLLVTMLLQGWYGENRVRQGYRQNKTKRMQLHLMKYSEVHRVRSYGWEARMKTEGGRKMIMRKILRGEDHLAH